MIDTDRFKSIQLHKPFLKFDLFVLGVFIYVSYVSSVFVYYYSINFITIQLILYLVINFKIKKY